jgi:hypothetical protein
LFPEFLHPVPAFYRDIGKEEARAKPGILFSAGMKGSVKKLGWIKRAGSGKRAINPFPYWKAETGYPGQTASELPGLLEPCAQILDELWRSWLSSKI